MTNINEYIQKTFEDIKISQENFEFWSARQLIEVLGYKERRKFEGVIMKAQIACQNSGQNIEDHFVPSDKMVDLGSGSQRKIDDFFLTRYACYLIAQNGDSRKTEIAFAQTYFANQIKRK